MPIDDCREKVRHQLRNATEPLTVDDLVQRTGYSRALVYRCIDEFRRADELDFAGRTSTSANKWLWRDRDGDAPQPFWLPAGARYASPVRPNELHGQEPRIADARPADGRVLLTLRLADGREFTVLTGPLHDGAIGTWMWR